MTCTSWGLPKLFNSGQTFLVMQGTLLIFTISTMKQCLGRAYFVYHDPFASGVFSSFQKTIKNWSYDLYLVTCENQPFLHHWEELPFFFWGGPRRHIFSTTEAIQLGHALGAQFAGVSGRRGVGAFFLTNNFWPQLDVTSEHLPPKTTVGSSFL